MQQYQQLASERTQLQAENGKLKKDAEATKKQLDTVTKQFAAYKAAAERNQAALGVARNASENSAKTLEDTKAKMQELIGRFRETLTTLRGVESEKTQLQQQVAQSNASFDRCVEKNYALFKVTEEVLDRYEHQGAFSYMARAEPFTRIKRTQVENLVDEYRQRAEELRVSKAEAAAGSQRSASGPPPAGGSPRGSGSGSGSSPPSGGSAPAGGPAPPGGSPPSGGSAGASPAPSSGPAPAAAKSPAGTPTADKASANKPSSDTPPADKSSAAKPLSDKTSSDKPPQGQ